MHALGHVVTDGRGTIDWAGERGSGKDVAGLICSLEILTQWHWSLGRGSSLQRGLLWMAMEALVGVKFFSQWLHFFVFFSSCMAVCPSRNWLIQVHQGLSSGHPVLIRLPSVTPTGTMCRGVSGLDVFSRARWPPP